MACSSACALTATAVRRVRAAEERPPTGARYVREWTRCPSHRTRCSSAVNERDECKVSLLPVRRTLVRVLVQYEYTVQCTLYREYSALVSETRNRWAVGSGEEE